MSEAGARLFEELMRFKPDGLTANGWAVKAGVSRTIWGDLRRHGNPSRRTLEKLLGAAGSSLAEFEALRVGDQEPAPTWEAQGFADRGLDWRGPLPAPVPVLAAGPAGQWGEAGSGIELLAIDHTKFVGKVDRPAALARDPKAYAVTLSGDSMWPRFRTGRRLLVSPAAALGVGDDVLVEMAGGKALIKELVHRSQGRVGLRQFNPDVTFAVEARDIAAIHKIVGEAI